MPYDGRITGGQVLGGGGLGDERMGNLVVRFW
jgi:hypothetical protein